METIKRIWLYLAQFILEWDNVSDKSCTENQKTLSMFNNVSPPENRAVCKIKWKHFA